MRECKFRGERVDNGEWIEGNLYIPNQFLRGIYISPKTTVASLNLEKEENITQEDIKNSGMVIGEFFEVIPEAVGEYTGFQIDNVDVYEGDLLTVPRHYEDDHLYETYTGHVIMYEGEWVVKSDTIKISKNHLMSNSLWECVNNYGAKIIGENKLIDSDQ